MLLKNYNDSCMYFRELLKAYWDFKKAKKSEMIDWKVEFVLEKIWKEPIFDVLEIGTSVGITALTLAFGMMLLSRKFKIYSIDIRDKGQKEILNLFPRFKENIKFHIYEDGKTKEFLVSNNTKKIDLLLIDGSHKKESVEKDFETFSSLVRRRGFIVFDDCKMYGDTFEYIKSLRATFMTDPKYQEDSYELAYMRV